MKKIITAGISILLITSPCFASSMPAGEIVQKFSISLGPSIAADFQISPNMSLGFSAGVPIYRGLFLAGRYDLRLLYKFLQDGKFSLSGVIGATGDPIFKDIGNSSLIGLELGVALSYAFTKKLTGRLNIVGGMPFTGGWGKDYLDHVAPASGIELGYKFSSNLEGTIGANGIGDFLGLNISF